MENHPIPQDVTGFKFKLIGSVTVKQFLYILGAAGMCGIFFILPISVLLKWPAIFLFAGLGAALAFLPIEGRPLDVMLINFLKAIPAENRFVFHKLGATALIHDFFIPANSHKPVAATAPAQKDNRRELLLNQLVRKNVAYKMDDEERQKLNNLTGMFGESDIPVTGLQSVQNASMSTPARSTIVRPPTTLNRPIRADEYIAPQQVQTTQPDIPAAPQPEPQPVMPIAAVEPAPQPVAPQVIEPEPIAATPAQNVTPENQIANGFPQIPDTPNIVLGIIKDARGRVLPNIIVEVIDQNKNPVRAFKTNALGQFSSATPLPAGHYMILVEDTRHVHEFSPIEIEIDNKIFQPLEIISTDQREKLRQELFGASAPTN